MDMNHKGVYLIFCKANGCIYVGSTRRSFTARWNQHRRNLQKGIHENSRLQNAWNAYGKDAFTFQIIEVIEGDNFIKREQYWLDHYRQNSEIFNLADVVENAMQGRIHSEETRAKLRAARAQQIPLSQESRNRIAICSASRRHTQEEKDKIGMKHAKEFPAFTNVITSEVIPGGHSLSALCRERGFNFSKMAAVARGDRLSWRGWVRSDRVNEYAPQNHGHPALKNLLTGQVILAHSNLAETCRRYGLTYRTMVDLVRGHTLRTSTGWILDQSVAIGVPTDAEPL